MSNNTKVLIKLREKILNINKYILEYGFNEDKDIFIKKEVEKIKQQLNDFEDEYTKKLIERDKKN
jgi:NAD(P)H-flavin reductase